MKQTKIQNRKKVWRSAAAQRVLKLAAGSRTVEEAVELALRFLDRHPGWAVIVSALRKDTDDVEVIGENLPRSRTRRADASDYSELDRLCR